jgi:hypothetical protein
MKKYLLFIIVIIQSTANWQCGNNVILPLNTNQKVSNDDGDAIICILHLSIYQDVNQEMVVLKEINKSLFSYNSEWTNYENFTTLSGQSNFYAYVKLSFINSPNWRWHGMYQLGTMGIWAHSCNPVNQGYWIHYDRWLPLELNTNTTYSARVGLQYFLGDDD